MASWLLPLGLGVLGFAGQQQSANAQNQANQIAGQSAESQRRIADRMLQRSTDIFDPIMDQTVLPRLTARATGTPPWAPQAHRQARSLAARMAFPRTDLNEGPRRTNPAGSGGAPV